MMFEYDVRKIEMRELEEFLNRRARHGWRLVEVNFPSALHAFCILEREVKRYTIRITLENKEMITKAGDSGTFNAVLQDNGVTIPLPSGASFVWTADDKSAVLTPDASTDNCVVTLPASDTAASVTITATTTDPTGKSVSGSITLPLTPEPQQFTVSITQTA